MDIKALIEQVRAAMAPKLQARTAQKAILDGIRAAAAAESRDLTADEATRSEAASVELRKIDDELAAQRERISELEDEQRRDEAADALAREVHPTGAGSTVPAGGEQRATGSTVRVGQEPRTFRADNDPKGVRFLQEVAATAITGRWSDDLVRHMAEEKVERGEQIAAVTSRAAGTGAFAGLVVPQYLVDMVAPHAKAGRPFADACRHHDLPADGMVVNISRITTGTSSDVQANEGDAVSETNIDDTLLSPAVQTNAGQQTLSRQAVERGTGVDTTTIEDLFRSHATKLDSLLLNQATNGLTNVATAISYTDATPTAAELYPKLLAGPSAVEAALLDQDMGDTFAVMHSRRWYWLQSQLTSTWPMFGQPGAAAQQAGVNYGERYGSGFRGILPSGVPAIVDNNIATNLGAGTNEDEIYFGAQSELHLWEDPSAPMLIRAEDVKAANLQILLVVYSYFAYTFGRRPHAQKVNGTGLITPTF